MITRQSGCMKNPCDCFFNFRRCNNRAVVNNLVAKLLNLILAFYIIAVIGPNGVTWKSKAISLTCPTDYALNMVMLLGDG